MTRFNGIHENLKRIKKQVFDTNFLGDVRGSDKHVLDKMLKVSHEMRNEIRFLL